MIDHDHDHSELSEVALRVRALETLLVEKRWRRSGGARRAHRDFSLSTRSGRATAPRVVARAWSDPDYRGRLLHDATSAIAELGYGGRQGEHMVALENTPERHNLVVCTLCSCYPWPVLGLPPARYKSLRAVIDLRGVLAEFGVVLPPQTQIRVWDSTAEIRYLVVPQLPKGAEGWSEERLAGLVSRDSMVGTGLALSASKAPRRERRARPRRHDGVRPERARSR